MLIFMLYQRLKALLYNVIQGDSSCDHALCALELA
jgi:hypothetical protein